MASLPQSRRTVAIPRLPKTNQGQHTTAARRRVAQACTACRVQKVRCDGIKPECKRCVSTQSNCDYVMPRKDRLKIMTELCRRSMELLRGYRNYASTEDQRVIDGIWAMFHEEDTQTRTAPSTPDSDNCVLPETLQTPILQQEPEMMETRQTSVSHQDLELRETYLHPIPFCGGLPTFVPIVSDEYFTTYGSYNETMAETNFGVWGVNSWLDNSCYTQRP